MLDVFIVRPVATWLLTLALALTGLVALRQLPVASMPEIDFPTIVVSANLPGASPETLAATVAAPLERSFVGIAGVSEMTSSSRLGTTSVVLQFDLERDIDSAARDVQGAINAARSALPSALPDPPSYRKVNPADAPVLILKMTSAVDPRGRIHDIASTRVAQRLAQVRGVGQVTLGGSSLPAIRVEVDPQALVQRGLDAEAVRQALVAATGNRPAGVIESGERRWDVAVHDGLSGAAAFRDLVVRWNDGAAVRIGDVARVSESVQDPRNEAVADGNPAVLLLVGRQPGANLIEMVDAIRALLPELRAQIPATMTLDVVIDRTPVVRGSLRVAAETLLIAMVLVVLVVSWSLRSVRAAIIPAVVVPVSIVATFAVMHLAGFSLNTLSLMALTVATGFVVDDAVVVLENAWRHLEAGLSPLEAARRGVREVGFTVVSMSLSLVAVFIPVLAMGGIVGRMLREFAVVLAASILISLVVSLVTTPMLCARLLRPGGPKHARVAVSEGAASNVAHPEGAPPTPTPPPRGRIVRWYGHTLNWALRWWWITLLALAATIAYNFHLYAVIPKGLIPDQDTGRLIGWVRADESASFQSMSVKLNQIADILRRDPEVEGVVAFVSDNRTNSGTVFASLRPKGPRQDPASVIAQRLSIAAGKVPGARLFLIPARDVRAGGRGGNAEYQFSLHSDDVGQLRTWEPRLREAMSKLPMITDVNTDVEDRGAAVTVVLDRDRAAELGLSQRAVSVTLNNLFAQRPVSTFYRHDNQYRVVLVADPTWTRSDSILNDVRIANPQGTDVPRIAGGGGVPLASVTRVEPAVAPMSVAHQGLFVSSTISFNLVPGRSLSEATEAIQDAMARLGVPSGLYGSFGGTASVFQKSMASQPWLILAAILTIYIVLGMLYESYIHPITILSTLPSAGVGALLALIATGTEFSIIAMIGVILLVGIVKKNAILMVDFALVLRRTQGLDARSAIHEACLVRFRPIMMTTAAAILGALPLALGHGEGGELRAPLGIAVVGGLLGSQLLTLYTTPVIFMLLDRLASRLRRRPSAPQHAVPNLLS